jgi:hypothetical protein
MKTKLLLLGIALAAMLPAQIAPSLAPLPSRDALADHYLHRAYVNAMQAAMLAGLSDASAIFAARAEVFAEVAEELRTRDFFKP